MASAISQDLYRYDQALDQLLETAVVTIDPSADTESDAVTEDAADATEAGSATNASTTYDGSRRHGEDRGSQLGISIDFLRQCR